MLTHNKIHRGKFLIDERSEEANEEGGGVLLFHLVRTKTLPIQGTLKQPLPANE